MMYGYAYWYRQRGYNALAPDFRCQGESEGDYIGLGATDSEDLRGWIDLILQRDPDAQIVLHGLSMGASTALILSGKEDAPSNIRAVISDCAYTDAYAMFREKIGSWFHLPAFPVIDSAELMIRMRRPWRRTRRDILTPLRSFWQNTQSKEHTPAPTAFFNIDDRTKKGGTALRRYLLVIL